jgi:hypothetical protein
MQPFGRNQSGVQVSAQPLAAEAASLIESETKNDSRLGVIQCSSLNKTSFTRGFRFQV